MSDQPYQSLINVLLEQQQAQSKLPPVARWNPPLSGDIDIHITSDGTWYHQNSAIQRQSLVKLFSTVLKREENDYFLVTPVEKWRIKVDDAPFIAVALDVHDKGSSSQALVFHCNTGDRIIASAFHPIRVKVRPQTGEPSPYILVRDNLEAKINRSVFYHLVELAEQSHDPDSTFYGVLSQGHFFRLE